MRGTVRGHSPDVCRILPALGVGYSRVVCRALQALAHAHLTLEISPLRFHRRASSLLRLYHRGALRSVGEARACARRALDACSIVASPAWLSGHFSTSPDSVTTRIELHMHGTEDGGSPGPNVCRGLPVPGEGYSREVCKVVQTFCTCSPSILKSRERAVYRRTPANCRDDGQCHARGSRSLPGCGNG
jgi:hypothetical protein